MKKVTVTVEGGVIQNIEVPEGVQVVVYDFDVEGIDGEQLHTNDEGDECIVSVWG